MSSTPSPPPKIHALTRHRMFTALAFAIVADVIQIGLGPVGWTFFDEIVDILAFIVTVRLIGFHWLLLPTVLLEFVPMVDMLPTWTGCVLWVLHTRNKQAAQMRSQLQNSSSKPG